MIQKTERLAAVALLALLAACSDNSDVDGDGTVSRAERATEMRRDGYLAMQPGRWRMNFTFTDIEVPRLGEGEKANIKAELDKGTWGLS